MSTFLECRNCNGTNVKHHEYRTFSYYYCSDCKGEVSANVHTGQRERRPYAHPALGMPYVGVDFAQNMQDALDEFNHSFSMPSSGPSGPPQLPVGSHNGSSDGSPQSQLSTGISLDQHSSHSQRVEIAYKPSESSPHDNEDDDIQVIGDHPSPLPCTPKDQCPVVEQLEKRQQEEGSLTDRLWQYLPVGSSKK